MANDAWSRATAETAAHSTLGLADESGEGKSGRRRWRRPAPTGRAEAKLSVMGEGSIMRGWQDAPAATANIIHERDIYLGKTGADLRGEDRIRPLTGGPTRASRFSIRFPPSPVRQGDFVERWGERIAAPAQSQWVALLGARRSALA